jgi:hypothetical protein
MDSAVTVFSEPLSPTRQTVSPTPMDSDTVSTAQTACWLEPKLISRFLIYNNTASVRFRPRR